jgi:predicted dehydrogenase
MSVAPLPPLPSSHAGVARLRVAVVGAGAMGKRHARVLASRADRFELVAVMDVDAGAATELARAYGVEAAAREGDAIDRADAVVVATPILAHALSVRRALASGKHVLVEKPIAASAQEARELVALAESSAARLFVGHSERFNPVVRALTRLVEPASIEVIALRRVGSARVRAGGGAGEGALINLGVHDFDIAAYLARSSLIPARATADFAASGADERAMVIGRTESGADVRIEVDQRPADGKRRRSIALTTRTHLWQGDLLALSLVRICRATGTREAIPLDTEEPLLAQALAFFGALALGGGDRSHEIATGHDGMRALIVADRARRAVSLPPAVEPLTSPAQAPLDARSRGKLGVPQRF